MSLIQCPSLKPYMVFPPGETAAEISQAAYGRSDYGILILAMNQFRPAITSLLRLNEIWHRPQEAVQIKIAPGTLVFFPHLPPAGLSDSEMLRDMAQKHNYVKDAEVCFQSSEKVLIMKPHVDGDQNNHSLLPNRFAATMNQDSNDENLLFSPEIVAGAIIIGGTILHVGIWGLAIYGLIKLLSGGKKG